MTNNLLWDSCFPFLRLEGLGARSFLQGQTSADLSTLNYGQLIQSCWLNTNGRLRALLEIRLDAKGADVLVLGGDADELATGFDQVIFPADKVLIKKVETYRRVQTLIDRSKVIWLSEDENIPEEWQPAFKAKKDEIEFWRLKYGLPISKGELSCGANPFELGLSNRVSLSKGCYLGQETMAKLASRGGVKQLLRFWESNCSIKIDSYLFYKGEQAGKVTSVLVTDNGSIGLALVRRKYLKEKELEGAEKQEIRIKLPENFQPPPFSDALKTISSS